MFANKLRIENVMRVSWETVGRQLGVSWEWVGRQLGDSWSDSVYIMSIFYLLYRYFTPILLTRWLHDIHVCSDCLAFLSFYFFQNYFWKSHFGHLFCPFLKILETFIKWKERQSKWENVGFLHDGHKNNWLPFICEHTFFSDSQIISRLCQYFPLWGANFGNSLGIGQYYKPKY